MASSIREHLNSLGYSPTTTGLGAIAQGLSSGLQQNIQNKLLQQQMANQNLETQWKNPYRQPSPLDVLGVAKGNPYMGYTMGQDPNMVAQLQSILNGVNQRTGVASTPAPQSASVPVQPAPVTQPVTPVPVTNWTPDDFAAFQAELKKRQGKTA